MTRPLKKQAKPEPAAQKAQNPALEGFLAKLKQQRFTEADAITIARYYYNQHDLKLLNAAQLDSLLQRMLDRVEKAEAPAPAPVVVEATPSLPETPAAPPEELKAEAEAPAPEALLEASSPAAEEPTESPSVSEAPPASEPEIVTEAAETKEAEVLVAPPEEPKVVEPVVVATPEPAPESTTQEPPPPAPVVEAAPVLEKEPIQEKEPEPAKEPEPVKELSRPTPPEPEAPKAPEPAKEPEPEAPKEIMEDRYWKKNGWSAKVIKNEDDDGWAVEICKEGIPEPVLVSPWVMGRDKKNPKPFDAPSFATFVKTASEIIRRAEQQRERALKKMVSSCWEGVWYKIVLQIIPDEFDPHAILSATDPDGEIISKIRVAPNYKLTQNNADKWVRGGFKEM